jgi:alkaline phosphatase
MKSGSGTRGTGWLRGLLLALTLLAAGCAGVTDGDGPLAAPKNVIILFADGAAPTQWEFGRYTARHLRNEGFAVTDVVFRQGTLGLLSTTALNAFVTDSAAGASALSTGHKVNNFVIAMAPDGTRHPTLMQVAKSRGKRIGLVTTAAVYDASPAAFSVHAAHRGHSQSIVDQYLQLEPDVLMGGGAHYFRPAAAGGGRKDALDVVAAFASRGWTVVRDTAALEAAPAGRLLGLFAEGDMALELDRDATREPSTAQMAAAALRMLERDNPRGFVLFVENENTDTAGHLNDAAALMHALWAFDKAVQVALEFQRRHADTLVIVVADHETGGLSPTYALRDFSQRSSGYLSADAQNLKMLEGITLSIAGAAERLGPQPSAATLDALVAQHFPGFSLDADLREAILKRQPLERNFTNPLTAALSRMVSRQTGLYWGTSGHTPQPVAVGAIGPGARLFRGFQDNTEFAKHLQRLLGAQ